MTSIYIGILRGIYRLEERKLKIGIALGPEPNTRVLGCIVQGEATRKKPQGRASGPSPESGDIRAIAEFLEVVG